MIVSRLRQIIRHDGYKLERISTARHNFDAHVYSATKKTVTMYHVFRPNIEKKKDGSVRELYPQTSDFGKTAFGVADYDEAKKLMEKIAKNEINLM